MNNKNLLIILVSIVGVSLSKVIWSHTKWGKEAKKREEEINKKIEQDAERIVRESFPRPNFKVNL